MKREFVALSLIAAILLLSLINIHYVENKTRALTSDIETAEKLCRDGDSEAAIERVEESLHTWLDWDSYAHIMLRHSEVDLVTCAYFDLLSELQSGNPVPEASYAKLSEHIRSISVMERIVVGSIF